MNMSSFLQSIIAERRNDARQASAHLPLERLERIVAGLPKIRSLKERLTCAQARGCQAGIIAEVKKASPSAGLLCKVYDPAAVARTYEQAGAVGVSVLTEPRHFLGRDEDLKQVRQAVNLPILRKDFVSDPYQVFETRALGADVILLITAGLEDHLLNELYSIALAIGLDVIVEVHTRDEMDRILSLDQAIIGVNSRNLNTLKTDLEQARDLAPLIPPGRLAIAESGIKSRHTIEDLQARGYKGFLIGETLMKSDNAAATLRALLGS
ncbi:MAG: indole-3-glycerol phosphate synthase TrpC [Verrucomicrobia bacterium]|nr:indole-3-glycerol phosphate synthase TrpC [Verrucomicrobiota bacterium]MBU1734601.1 indole-3-glycerol phosphate synthase TrpC [Verrucomicrobiota bacterium]MBU1857820.1 indole-3-glycerol phosphate synthase TrpC [Verrucomicrobiota bacterium]